MNTTKTNNISFYNEQGTLTLNAKQFDTGRRFVFHIMDNDEPFSLSGCTAYLRIAKADGTQFQGHECCSVDASHIIVDTSVGNGSQILTSAGINICELHLEDVNGISLTTWNFNILVEPRVHDGSHISSVDSYDVLDIAKRNEEARQKNEEIRQENETQRQENEIQRQENEKTRKNKFEIFESKIGEITDEAKSYAAQAQSWTVGGTNTRTEEDTDNSKHYYEQIKSIAESFSGTLRPKGTIAFASLPSLSSAKEGDMYNISNQFTTNTDFKEGSGHIIPAGSNIYKTADGKWDVLAGTPVTGIKGDKENTYRRGNVNITAANVGALSDNGTAVAAKKLETSRNISLSGDVTGGTAFDGTASKTITATLANSGVAAGDYGALELVKRNDGSVWVSNNAGLHGTSAISTWTAKQDCNISFNWKVSSESASYDYLNITAAGTQILANTGGTAEQTGELTAVLKKDQSIKFTYRKDSSANNGADRAEIFGMKYGTGTNTPNTVVYESNVGNYFTITNNEYGFYPGMPQLHLTVDAKGRITKEQTIYEPKGITRTAATDRDGLMSAYDKSRLNGLYNTVYTETNFNSCDETGFYRLSGTVYNTPDGTTTGKQWGCISTVSNVDSDEQTQIGFEIDRSNPRLYIRGKYEYDNDGDTEWEYGPWREITNKSYNDNEYAKKSIYDDTTVSMGRKSGSVKGSNSFCFGNSLYPNTVSGESSAVLGGINHTASGTYSAILGGISNEITNRGNSAIVGGVRNKINEPPNSDEEFTGSAIIGGIDNQITSGKSVILGGNNNHTQQTNTAIIASNNSTTDGKSCATAISAFYGKAKGNESCVLGGFNNETGINANYSCAEGHSTKTEGYCAHAEGHGTIALQGQHVMGFFNDTSKATATNNSGTGDGTILCIGNGTETARSNAARIDANGKLWCKKSYSSTGADYAELFEWEDSNPSNEDRRGYFVSMEGEKIRIASPDDNYILGIVSANPAVLGNTDMEWQGQFMKDNFGDFIKEKRMEVIKDTDTDEAGNIIVVEKEIEVEFYKVNPNYDSDAPYTDRLNRPEWDAVGMLGVLAVYDDGTCQVNGFCTVAEGGIATSSDTGYRVIKRITDNIVKVIFK